MAVVEHVSQGCTLHCDLTGAALASGTYTSATIVRGVKDISFTHEGPKQDKTQQIHSKRGYLPGLRTIKATVTMLWDAADTDAGTSHAELFAAAMAKTKCTWQIVQSPGSVGSSQFRSKGLISSLSVPSILGDNVVATMEITFCQTPAWAYTV